MRKLIKSFRVRYKQAIQEIKDLNQKLKDMQKKQFEVKTATLK